VGAVDVGSFRVSCYLNRLRAFHHFQTEMTATFFFAGIVFADPFLYHGSAAAALNGRERGRHYLAT
jgi:hypothetical protein